MPTTPPRGEGDQKRPPHPIFPSLKKRLADIEEEKKRAPQWDYSSKGKKATLANIKNDAVDTVKRAHGKPWDFLKIVREKLDTYVDRGPDINKPVPLKHNRFKTGR